MAFMALKYFPCLNYAVGLVSTSTASEPFWPTYVKQGIVTFGLGAVQIHEIKETHAFLKLNFILLHADTPIFPYVVAFTHNISMAAEKW